MKKILTRKRETWTKAEATARDKKRGVISYIFREVTLIILLKFLIFCIL